MSLRPLLSVALLALLSSTRAPAAAQVIHVDIAATAGGDGSSWASALVDLTDALAAATPGTEVRVAEGTYFADSGTLDPELAFEIPSGVTVLGGYPTGGGERDPSRHPTILDGDLLGDDGFDPMSGGSGGSDNTRRLVRIIDGDGVVLDGFALRNGRTVFASDPLERSGACLFVRGGAPTIRNCRVERGSAEHHGGGALVSEAAVSIENCVFTENRAADYGAGLALFDADGTSVIACRIEDNTGSSGAGIFVGAEAFPSLGEESTLVTIDRCEFIGNQAVLGSTQGGALHVGGATVTVTESGFTNNIANGGGGAYLVATNTTVERCEFHGNQAEGDGGPAIYVDGGTLLLPAAPPRSPTIVSCLISGNMGGVHVDFDGSAEVINVTIADNEVPGIFSQWPALFVGFGASLALRNSIVWANYDSDFFGGVADHLAGPGTYTVTESLVEDWDGSITGTGFAADPEFVGPEDYRLAMDSPGIDAGADASLPSGATLDLDGEPRIQDGDGDAIGRVDLGSYEFPAPRFLRGDCSGDSQLDLSDAIGGLSVVFSGVVPNCRAACDANADAALDIADAIFVLGYLFTGSPPPPPPFPDCDLDGDGLGCGAPGCP